MSRALISKVLKRFGIRVTRVPRDGAGGKGFIAGSTYSISFKKILLDGQAYFVPDYAWQRPAVRALLRGKLYEPQTHAFVAYLFSLLDGDMVHAGTFFGDMLPSFSRSVGGRVFAFEPVLENYVLAKQMVDENSLQNVLLFHAALGSEITSLRIDSAAGDGLHAGGASRISNSGDLCVSLTIDAMPFDTLRLIQLDVEGFELNALNGAINAITKYRPIVAVEDNSNNCGALLKAHGYALCREIPGLKIWVADEREDYQKAVAEFHA